MKILNKTPSFGAGHKGFPTPALFWILAFAYASFLALIFQKLLLPLMPELHAGNGLLKNDAILFHKLALEAAEKIHLHGWTEWRLFPEHVEGSGNVGVLSALYALFGPDPAWFIPINAAAHATGAMLLYLIGPLLWPGRIGWLGGIVAAVLFLVFPSALQWYGQIHKDAFAIAGILIMLYAYLREQHMIAVTSRMASSVVIMFGGALLLAAVRPFFLVVIVVAFVVPWITLFFASIIKDSFILYASTLCRTLCLIAIVALVAGLASVTEVAKSRYGDGFDAEGVNNNSKPATNFVWKWKENRILPHIVDRIFERASELRVGFITFNKSVGAGSAIDSDHAPDDAGSLIAYLPRALVVGLFAPFPSSWAGRVSATRLVGAVETCVWDLFALGVLLLFYRRPSRALFAGVIFAATLLTVISYLNPNVGTLYRQRFGPWMFILLCGATGWASVVLQLLSSASSRGNLSSGDPNMSEVSENSLTGNATNSIETLAAAGAVVLMVTLLCYLGFMARDLLLVKTFGMNYRMDSFFSAAMMPMFFVTVFAIPMSDALTRPFLHVIGAAGLPQAAELIQSLLGGASVLLGAMSVLVGLFAEPIIRVFLRGIEPNQVGEAALMLRFFIPIVFLSAWTVIGNAILNSLHHSRQAALAQLVVPVFAIGSILVAPKGVGVYPAIIGMVSGTLVNAFVISAYVSRLGVSLVPRLPVRSDSLCSVLNSYSWLMLAALFGALTTPLNYFFASATGEGALSVWALASKMVLLFNGLASVGVASVLLPHLARLANQRKVFKVRNDMYFILLSGSWLGSILALAVSVFSQPLVATLFSAKDMSKDHAENLAAILQIGAAQLPVVIAAALIVKVTAVAGTSSRLVGAAAGGLILNLTINLILVPRVGVLGIAVASLMTCGLTTAYLAMVTRRECGFGIREVFVLMVSWLVWAGACFTISSESEAAVVCTFLGLAGLAWGQWKVWSVVAD